MKTYLLSLMMISMAAGTAIGQDQSTHTMVRTIIENDDSGKKTIEIITSEDEASIQALVDSLLKDADHDKVEINVIRMPGMEIQAPFQWMGMDGIEDLEHVFEMGDLMKWFGAEDLEDLRQLKWQAEDRPFLGIIIDTDEKIERGIRIMNIVERSAAESAGLQKEDILLELDHHPINSLDDLVEVLSEKMISDTVVITYSREAKTTNTAAVLRSRAESDYDLGKSFNFMMPSCCQDGKECPMHGNKDFKALVHKQRPKLGVYVENLDDEMIRDLQVKSGKGVLITKVLDETAASKMGLKINDVILTLNGKTVDKVEELHELLSEQKLGDEIEISYLRYGLLKEASGVLFEFDHHSAIDEMIFFND
jgi:membrane-associated protease RseP (regulator of RpoE activity)